MERKVVLFEVLLELGRQYTIVGEEKMSGAIRSEGGGENCTDTVQNVRCMPVCLWDGM